MAKKRGSRILVLGLVGGIASGKSFVAERLERLGARVIAADKIGHDILQQPLIARRVGQVFGTQVLDDRGQVDRRALAARVFGDDPASARRRLELEKLLHPLIHAEVVRQIRGLQESPDAPPAVVVDAPLLLEAGWAPMCGVILFVETPAEVRLQRALDRGWTAEQFRARETAQLVLASKRSHATHVVDGQSPATELDLRLQEILSSVPAQD